MYLHQPINQKSSINHCYRLPLHLIAHQIRSHNRIITVEPIRSTLGESQAHRGWWPTDAAGWLQAKWPLMLMCWWWSRAPDRSGVQARDQNNARDVPYEESKGTWESICTVPMRDAAQSYVPEDQCRPANDRGEMDIQQEVCIGDNTAFEKLKAGIVEFFTYFEMLFRGSSQKQIRV